ncbi:MptD family putative ECF transporter S component, partial [Lactobacillus crispatus]
LNTRDFINIGVFTALMFVIVFAFGMLGFIPAAMYAGFLLSILVNGTVFALFTARTPKMGALTIMLILIEVLFFVTGHWVGG